jgi:hypothetical protein
MKNESNNPILYVVFLLGSFLGCSIPFIIASYFEGGKVYKAYVVLVTSIPFIIVLLFILFFKKRIKEINDSLNNDQSESILTDSMTINLLKVFFGGLGFGAFVDFIGIIFEIYF